MNWLGGISGVGNSFTHKPLVSDSRRAGSVALIYGICCPLPTLAQLMPTLALRAWGHLWTTHLAPQETNLFLPGKRRGPGRMRWNTGGGQGLIKENRQISGRDQTKYQGMRNLGFSLGERQALQLQSRPSVLQRSKNPPRFQDLTHSELQNPAALKGQVLVPVGGCPGW